MRKSPFPRNIVAIILLVLLSPIARASEWIPVPSPAQVDWKSVHFFNGRFIATGSNEISSGIIHSEHGQTWTAASLPPGFTPQAIAKGPETLLAAGEINGNSVVCVSPDGVVWTVSATLAQSSTVVHAVHTLDRFWLISESGLPLISTDGEHWETVSSGTSLGPMLLDFDPQPVGMTSNGTVAVFGFVDGKLQNSYPTSFEGPTLALAAGTDRAVTLIRGTNRLWFAVSGNGNIWLAFDHDFRPVQHLSHAGGRFWATGNGTILSSVDGARWADRSEGLNGANIRSVAAGNGILVAAGDGGTIFTREIDDLPPVILQQHPVPTMTHALQMDVAEGDPLHLAIDLEAPDEVAIRWQHRRGQHGNYIDLENQTAPVLRLPSMTTANAGYYRAIVEKPGHTPIHSVAVAVSVAPREPVPVEWKQIATAAGNLSRLATDGSTVIATGHEGQFENSLLHNHGRVPYALSSDGAIWRSAKFASSFSPGWNALGYAAGRFWLANGGDNRVAFSSDGIAWSEERIFIPGPSGINLIGEHQGNLFAAGTGMLSFKQPNGEWIAQFPPLFYLNFPGGYLSEGDTLLIGGASGIVEWKDGVARRVHGQSFDFMNLIGQQPRLLRSDHTLLLLGRGKSVSSVSRDGENWTDLAGQLQTARDGIFANGNFWAAADRYVQSSSDGIWWTDRSAGIGSARVSAILADADFLYVAGDEGKIFRRPARAEPAFSEHPVSGIVVAGQSIRFAAHASGSGEIAYQWHRDATPIPGETGAILEIRNANSESAGSYSLQATNEAGSAFSAPATLTLRETPLSSPWQRIGQIPANTALGRLHKRYVYRAGGNIVAVANGGNLLGVSRNGTSWVIARPPYSIGSDPGAGNTLISETPELLFAPTGNGIMTSSDGLLWKPAPELPPNTSKVVQANDLVVAATANGLFWSLNGIDWTASNVNSPISSLAHGDGVWAAAEFFGRIWMSSDGREWVSRDLPPSGSVIGIAAGNGLTVVATSGTQLHRTESGQDWETISISGMINDLRFIDGHFWRSGFNGLHVSKDGRAWAHRGRNVPAVYDVEYIDLDDVEMRILAGSQIYRQALPLEPLFYVPPSAPRFGFPGETITLHAPAHHGSSSISYSWRRNGQILPDQTGSSLTLPDFSAADAVPYAVHLASPFGNDSATLYTGYIGNYGSWSNAFRAGSPAADPKNLGIPNLLRYAFHLDPVSPDRTLLPRVATETINGETHATLQFQLLAGTSDFSWICEKSTDLVDWIATTGWTVESDERTGSLRKIKLRSPEPVAPEAKEFFRVRVNQPAP